MLPPTTSGSPPPPPPPPARERQRQRQRKWAPKVRTGCKTCKIRKKKCDETKPHCLRCLKDKFTCDGYTTPKPWVFEPAGQKMQHDGDVGEVVGAVGEPEAEVEALPPVVLEPDTTLASEVSCYEPGTTLQPELSYPEPIETLLSDESCFETVTTLQPESSCFELATTLVSDESCFEPATTSQTDLSYLEPPETLTLSLGSARVDLDYASLPLDAQDHERLKEDYYEASQSQPRPHLQSQSQSHSYSLNSEQPTNSILTLRTHDMSNTTSTTTTTITTTTTTTTTSPTTTRDSDLFLLEPCTPWSSETDRNFCQYFLLEFAPLLSTTSQWRYFWHTAVPQAAWLDAAVTHAVVAVAATYESRKSGVDRTELILGRTNLAIRAFASSRSVSPDVALILCRLFSSMAQCRGEFRTATVHMNSGQKILREATRSGKPGSEIMRIMAPTVLALTTDEIGDDEDVNPSRFSPEKRLVLDVLKTIRSQYGRLLHSWTPAQWDRIDSPTSGVLSIAWSTLTQAFSSALYPELVVFGPDDPILPARLVTRQLRDVGGLLSLHELAVQFDIFIHDLREIFGTPRGILSLSEDFKSHLKMLVENYVVQASVLEPRMTAGTFWHQYSHQQCYVERHLQALPDDLPRLRGGRVSNDDVVAESTGGRVEGPGADLERRKREYYLEHVCHHRSGFMPLAVGCF